VASKKIQPTNKRNECPVCGDNKGKCRTTDTELILCMNTLDKSSTPDGWKFLGLTKGGGQWGRIVPIGQPASGNFTALRQQREAERAAVETARLARLKPKDIRDAEYRHQVANCPILEADRADLMRRGLNDEDLARLTPINDGRGGYTTPIRDKDGLMVGGQIRSNNVAEGGRYRWATTGKNQLPETGELPLAHWSSSNGVEVIALVEGTGVKPYLTAKRLNALAIGAAGGNFSSSHKTLKLTLDRYSDSPVVLVPDAGAVANKSVMRQYANVQALLKKWGRELRVVWWGQMSKQDGDIDEISPELFTATISWDEFWSIAVGLGTVELHTEESLKDEPEKEARGTISEQVLKLAFDAEYFCTPDKATYADIRVDGVRETYSIRSRAFKLWLTSEFYDSEAKAINSNAMAEVLGVLDAKAVRSKVVREVNLRTAEHQGKIYLDLGSPDWSAVEIDAQGWRIIAEPPVRFIRPESLLALPTPIEGGSLNELRELINAESESWILIITFLLFCFCPNRTYPVLVLSAHRGSGKTAAAEILKGLIDPGKGGLPGLPNTEGNLAARAVNRWLMVYDNVGYLNTDMSDLLCRMATKFGYSTRTLFTTIDETTAEFTRPQIITAIDALVTRDDLANRVLMAQLGEITEEKRLPQSELNSKVEAARPRILGALLMALSRTLAALPNTKPKRLPRMADYGLFSIAAEVALGLKTGEFMKAFDKSAEQSRQIVIESSPIGEAILKLMEAPANSVRWKGTASQLLNSLESFSDEGTVRSRYWPKASNSFKRQLNRLIPDLRERGILISETAYLGTKLLIVERRLKISTLSTPKSPKDLPGDNKQDLGDGVDSIDTGLFSIDTLAGAMGDPGVDTLPSVDIGIDEKTGIDTEKSATQKGLQDFSVDSIDTFSQSLDKTEQPVDISEYLDEV
jgi:hypothetical protein